MSLAKITLFKRDALALYFDTVVDQYAIEDPEMDKSVTVTCEEANMLMWHLIEHQKSHYANHVNAGYVPSLSNDTESVGRLQQKLDDVSDSFTKARNYCAKVGIPQTSDSVIDTMIEELDRLRAERNA